MRTILSQIPFQIKQIMAAECSPQSVADSANCFLCVSEKMLNAETVYLLAQILKQLDPMADVSVENIARQSRCFAQCLSGKMLYAATVWLLCQIDLNTITPGTGTPQLFSGHGAPVGLQPGQNALLNGFYVDLDSGVVYPWDLGTGDWMTP